MTSFEKFFANIPKINFSDTDGVPMHLQNAVLDEAVSFQPQLEMHRVAEKLGFPQIRENLVSGLIEEVGELAGAIARISGYKKIKAADSMDNLKDNLGKEIADVLVYLFQIGNFFGIDVLYVFQKKLLELQERKYK